MTSREDQLRRYTLTAKGCEATGGHRFEDGECVHCGTESPQADQ